MSKHLVHADEFFLSGERLERVRQALKVAEHQTRLAQSSGYRRHVEDALEELEQALADHLVRIENALEDDKAEAEETGEAERERQAWYPQYRAA